MTRICFVVGASLLLIEGCDAQARAIVNRHDAGARDGARGVVDASESPLPLDASRRKRDASSNVHHDGSRSTPDAGGRPHDSGPRSRDASPPDASVDASEVAPTPRCQGTTVDDALLSDPRICLRVFASGLGAVRQMAFASNGDLFVNNGSLIVLWDADGDGVSSAAERTTFSTAAGLNHGVAFSPDGLFVYASSPTAVFRWKYSPGLRVPTDAGEVVVTNVPGGGHVTRTLAFDSKGNLLLSVGSGSNVDTVASNLQYRAQLRRFSPPPGPMRTPITYSTGEIVTSGMRNEVGIFVDESDQIWGVENGRDSLSDVDFGGDIHNDNPGEEINRVDGLGSAHYGFPYCYSEFKVAGGSGPGSQWADESLPAALRKTDGWCKDAANVHPPEAVMQAHWAPLGIIQYTGDALPFKGDFIITAHGSWNRVPAVGRLLARARYVGGKIVSIEPIIQQGALDGSATAVWDVRPVDVRQGPDDALYFSDDDGGRVFSVSYAKL